MTGYFARGTGFSSTTSVERGVYSSTVSAVRWRERLPALSFWSGARSARLQGD